MSTETWAVALKQTAELQLLSVAFNSVDLQYINLHAYTAGITFISYTVA